MAATAAGNALSAEERKRMCSGKKKFAREGEAVDWVILCRRRGVFPGGRVYKCTVCSKYHVTSHSKSMAA